MAGRVIWLPELTQEKLNILCLASFVVLRKAGVYRKDPPTLALRDQIVRLYTTFDRRAEPIEMFLGGGGGSSSIAKESLSSPAHIASLISRAQNDSKLSPQVMARRLEGMRLLPDPKAFDTYIGHVSRLITATHPVISWMPMVEEQMEALEKAVNDRKDDGHFDAGVEASSVDASL